MGPTIALGVVTALDTDTARQLHDYGALDDAGVAAALEQTGLQRDGAGRWPGYLARVQCVAAIIENDGDLTLAAFQADTLEQERGVLESLFAVMPDTANGRCVSWHAADWSLLAQRAYRHQLRAPSPVHAWPRQPLCHLFNEDDDGQSQSQSDNVRDNAIRLYASEATQLGRIDPTLREAVYWYGMDLRRRCVIGDVDAETARQRTARAAARAVLATDGAVS